MSPGRNKFCALPGRGLLTLLFAVPGRSRFEPRGPALAGMLNFEPCRLEGFLGSFAYRSLPRRRPAAAQARTTSTIAPAMRETLGGAARPVPPKGVRAPAPPGIARVGVRAPGARRAAARAGMRRRAAPRTEAVRQAAVRMGAPRQAAPRTAARLRVVRRMVAARDRPRAARQAAIREAAAAVVTAGVGARPGKGGAAVGATIVKARSSEPAKRSLRRRRAAPP